jgi:hypothetical protein
MQRFLTRYSEEVIVNFLKQHSTSEIKNGQFCGFSLSEARRHLARVHIEIKREEERMGISQEEHRKDVARAKRLLLTERAARGEFRGSWKDKLQIWGITYKERRGGNKDFGVRPASITVVSEPEVKEKTMLPGLDIGSGRRTSPVVETDLARQIRRAVEQMQALLKAEEELKEFQGKVLGGGSFMANKMVVTGDGILVFAGGQTKGQSNGEQKPDFRAGWSEIAGGTVLISVGETSFDKARQVVKLVRGRPDSFPVPVLITERGSGREFRFVVPGGDQLAQLIRNNADLMAMKDEIEANFELVRKEHLSEVNAFLKGRIS